MELSISAYRDFNTPSLAKLSLNPKGRPVVKIGRTSYEMRLTGKPNLTLPQWKTVAERLDTILVQKNILDGRSDTNKNRLDGLRVHDEGITFDGRTTSHVQGTNTTALWGEITHLAQSAPAAAAAADGARAGAQPAPAPVGAAVPAAQANARLIGRQLLRDPRFQEGGRLTQWTPLINDLVSDAQAATLVDRLGLDAGQAKEYLREEAVTVATKYLTQTIDDTIREREGWQEVRGSEERTNALRDNVVGAITDGFQPHMNDAPAVEGGEVLITDAGAKQRVRERVLNPDTIRTCVQTRLQALLEEEAARPATPVIGSYLQDCRAQAQQLWDYGQIGYGWFNEAREWLAL